MLKSIVAGTVTFGVATVIDNEYAVKKWWKAEKEWKEKKDKLLLEKPKKPEWEEKKDKLILEKPKELEYAVGEYWKALKEWEEKKDKLILEKPKELEYAVGEYWKALKEWEEKVGKLKEPKLADYYGPTSKVFRMCVSVITTELVRYLLF